MRRGSDRDAGSGGGNDAGGSRSPAPGSTPPTVEVNGPRGRGEHVRARVSLCGDGVEVFFQIDTSGRRSGAHEDTTSGDVDPDRVKGGGRRSPPVPGEPCLRPSASVAGEPRPSQESPVGPASTVLYYLAEIKSCKCVFWLVFCRLRQPQLVLCDSNGSNNSNDLTAPLVRLFNCGTEMHYNSHTDNRVVICVSNLRS